MKRTANCGRTSIEARQGCLLGLAIADALSAPLAYLTRLDLSLRHGTPDIVDFLPWAQFRPGSCTSHTQLAAATLRGYTRAARAARSGAPPVEFLAAVHEEYDRWLGALDNSDDRGTPDATITVLSDGVRGTPQDPINDCLEAGALARSAVVGLVCPTGRALEFGTQVAAMTHGHPLGHLPAGFLSEVLAQLVAGRSLRKAIDRAAALLAAHPDGDETLAMVNFGRSLSAGPVSVQRAVEACGDGWSGAQATALALYFSLTALGQLEARQAAPETAFRSSLCAVVNALEAPETVAPLVGALLGATLGIGALPRGWLRRVEGRHRLVNLAANVCGTGGLHITRELFAGRAPTDTDLR